MLALLFTLVLSVASFALVLFSLHVATFPRSIRHISVALHVCYYSSLHFFVVTLHCIVLMFFSRVVTTLCALLSLLFLHWCSILLMLVFCMPIFLHCYVVFLALLHYSCHIITLLYLCYYAVFFTLPLLFFSCCYSFHVNATKLFIAFQVPTNIIFIVAFITLLLLFSH